ncbi:MAG: phage baseplate assembly protein V [Azoarcus sp.]|jgi:phage baseplate assembly protein V|nr:phage baseplate assembly protein V [Azoarcus sp.]
MSQDLSPEQNRRLESVLRFGTVAAVDFASQPPLCRAQSGGLTTDWLRWMTPRAGNVREWLPPTVGEECLIFSPSGETDAGAILSGLFNDARPAPEKDGFVTARHWDDGAVERYDQATHGYLLDVPAGGSITLRIGGSFMVMTQNSITLAALADELGVSLSTVSTVTSGKSKSYPVQRAIAERLGSTIEALWPGQIRLRRNRPEKAVSPCPEIRRASIDSNSLSRHGNGFAQIYQAKLRELSRDASASAPAPPEM